MVKTPKMRHSKPQREPVTIELEPDAVSRVEEAGDDIDTSQTAEPQPAAEFVEAEKEGVSDPAAESTETAGEPKARAEAAAQAEAAAEPITTDPESEAPHRPYGYGFEAEEAQRRERAEALDAGEAADPEQPSVVSEPKRNGWAPVGAAGLIGAVLALIAAGGLQYAGVLGNPGATSGGPALDGVQSEIASLQQEIAALKQSAAAPDTDIAGQVDALSASLDQVKADVASLQQAVGSGGSGDNAGLQALDGRVKEIETAIAGLGQTGAQAPAAEIAAIGDRIAGLEALVKEAGDKTTSNEGRLAALEQNFTDLSGKIDTQAAQPKIAMAIATSALKAAVDRGAPFLAELETFAAIAPDAPEIPELRVHAEKGVASREDILAETDEAAKAMIAAERTVDANAGFFERLLNSAESLVTVRPIGAVEGEGVPETVARMEVALNAGDYAAAIAEYEKLPENVRAAAGAFMEKVRNRLAVERLLDQAVAGAMKA
ncbi:phage tail protein [Allomesorhizobium alhagi]|uniref:Putative phage tail protein n=1 Tax=Mesorhizobium alhagi CCNWXJ12-2 TaxID=1107882 RepID=H0HLE9_9HYPH|nr:phage tail protein [Mesorhizobium alhagi]EHK58478.1 putative phage tail protein [Mesorhizobium alhagi CCNWXJ12-2]